MEQEKLRPTLSHPSSPPRKHPKEFVSSDQAGDLEVRLSLVSAHWNNALTNFFTATTERTRLYWLLASLARHQSVRTANAMAFDFFLALVPLLGLAGWTASIALRDGPGDLSTVALLRDVTPTQVDQFIGQQVQAMAASHLAPLAALAGWWLVSSAFNTMIGVFQESFECEQRNWIHTRVISLAFALLAMMLVGLFFGFGVIVALAPVQLVDPILASLEYFGLVQAALGAGVFAIASAFMALLYRYSLKRPGRKRHVWPGAFTATILGGIATAALGYYASHIAQYALFYGGLAAIIVVLTWLWVWSSAILVGAEINVALEDVRLVKHLEAVLQGEPQSEPAPIGSAPDTSGPATSAPASSGPSASTDGHFVAAEPLEAPTHTPRSSGNSDGD